MTTRTLSCKPAQPSKPAKPSQPARSAWSVAGLALTLLLVTAACGSEDPTPAAGASGGTVTESTTAPTTGSTDTQAVSVVFRRTGGIRPTTVNLVYAANREAPAGANSADVEAILEAASDPQLREAELTPVPKNTCCDRQEYVVLITYADGTTTSFRTLDGLQQPKVFEDLLSMLG